MVYAWLEGAYAYDDNSAMFTCGKLVESGIDESHDQREREREREREGYDIHMHC